MASTFVTASRTSSPIARGLAGPGLLAHVIVSKFCDHLPLYRYERMLARFGVNLSRSTLCDWLAQSAALLRLYTAAGFLEIDNNAAERALRAVAIGRKNYLFFGSDLGC
jgi:transposase